METDSSSRELFYGIQKDTSSILNNGDSERIYEDFKEAINLKFNLIHEELYKAETEFIENVLANYDEIKSGGNNQVKPMYNKFGGGLVENKQSGFKSKLNKLLNHLDFVSKKTSAISNSSTLFEKSKLEELFIIDSQESLKFKQYRKIGVTPKNKTSFDITWAISGNSSKVTVNPDFPETLLINANSCYNWYKTNKILNKEDFYVEFESKIIHQNSYFYIGLQNEKIFSAESSNCMCCTINNAFYLKCDGNVNYDNKKVLYQSLNYSNRTTNSVVGMRVLLSEKQIYFSVNGGKEEGPFPIQGNEFRIISGSCNNCTGTCTISECYLI